MPHALWLIPAEPVRSRLAALIDDLARAHATPRFPPHLTLLSGLPSRPDLEAAAAALARALEPLDVTLTRVDGLPEYYRALFLDVEGAGLAPAHARAVSWLDAPRDSAYRPHVSLLYGELEEAAKAAIVARVGRRWDLAARLGRLDLVRIEGGPESWAPLLSRPLGR